MSSFAARCIAVLLVGMWTLGAAAAVPSHATAGTAPDLAALTKTLVATSHRPSLKALKASFTAHGLRAVLYQDEATGQQGIVWVTVDDAAVIAGRVYTSDGTNLTREAMLKYGVYLPLGKILERAATSDTHSFVLGTAGPVLTFFLDPNCIYCHQMYDAIEAPLAQGKLRVRIVMVGLIKADSAARAASILESKDPAAALAQNEAKFDVANEEGGLPIAKDATSSKMASVVSSNNSLMVASGSTGTPTLIYCDRTAGKPVMRDGAIPAANLMQSIGDGGGKYPACAN